MIKEIKEIFEDYNYKNINLELGYKSFVENNINNKKFTLDESVFKIDLGEFIFLSENHFKDEAFKSSVLNKYKPSENIDNKVNINIDNIAFMKNMDYKQYYFLVELDINEANNLVRLSDSLIFNLYKIMCLDEDNYEKEMDKNTSILIILNEDKIKDKELMEKFINQWEEDPYYFRKYIFTYTDKDFILLKENLDESYGKNTVNTLNNIVKDADEFKKFKNKDNESIYKIVSKLFIKIPFLKIPEIDTEKLIELEDLELEIKENLVKKGLIINDEYKIKADLIEEIGAIDTKTYDLKKIEEIIKKYE